MDDLRGPNNTEVGEIEAKILRWIFVFCLLTTIAVALVMVI